MTLQIVVVDDAAPGATTNSGMSSDGTTITSSKALAGTSLDLSGTLEVTGVTTFIDAVSQNVVYGGTAGGEKTANLKYRVISYGTNGVEDLILNVGNGVEGQQLTVYLINDGGFDLVVKPTAFSDGTTYTLDTAGDYCNLFFLLSNWHIHGGTGTLA